MRSLTWGIVRIALLHHKLLKSLLEEAENGARVAPVAGLD
jgi:hypothetical protein